ncbi:hypothetical protein EII38_06920 [Streptococcus minor]|uniref:Pig-X/Pbn1 n=1 Tax=Streptococcus minor TaxID=229549 RepID=A0A3P1VFP2_9STRE|nr:hypothetical protein [Streptococcus minor]RRD31213.1 hypothetical protein EII38_06920 [Streptococcus minor]
MKDLFRYTWFQELHDNYKSVNSFFYYLRKIPFLGNYIPDTIYKSYGFKSVLFWLFGIAKLPFRFVAKFFWLACYIFLGNAGINLVHGNMEFWTLHKQAFLLGFLMWVAIVGIIIHGGKAMERNIAKPERDFVQNFGLSWTIYLQKQALIQPFLTTIFYIPALITLSVMSGNIWYFLVGLTTIISWDLAGSALQRASYQIRKKLHIVISFLWASSILALILVLIYFYRHLNSYYLVVLFFLQLLILSLAYHSVMHFKDMDGLIAYFMEESTILDQKVFDLTRGNEYTRQGLDMQKKLTLKNDKDLTHLTGMTYINALLFQRYRSILLRKLMWRMGWILLIWAGGQLMMSYAGIQLKNKELLAIMPYLFMAMYALSLGRTIAQLVFVNCDISMLHYPFYRQGKNILAGFNYRWFQSFKYNICFAIGIFLLLLGWGRLSFSPSIIALLGLLLFSLTALLSFHDLFIYYLLQPFTKDMEVTNPIYKILSHGLYWVAYLNMQFDDLNSILYVYIVSALLLLYVGIGYLILLKIAPKTFVLKQ